MGRWRRLYRTGLHQRAGAVSGQLRLTAFSTAMRGLVAPVVRDLRAAHPDLALALKVLQMQGID